jgi:hypothetical protein
VLKAAIVAILVCAVSATAGIRWGGPISDVYWGGPIAKVYHNGYVFQKAPPAGLAAYGAYVNGRGTAEIAENFGGSFTIASWVYSPELPVACVFQQLYVPDYGNIWGMHGWHSGIGGWFVMLYDGSENPYIFIADASPNNEWHLVVMTRDTTEGTLRLWVNGESNSIPDATTAPNYTHYVIGDDFNGAWAFPGTLDSQFAWNRALSNGEVEDLFTLTNVTDWSTATFASTSLLVTNSCLFMHRHNEASGSTSVDFMGYKNITWDADPTWRSPGVVSDFTE